VGLQIMSTSQLREELVRRSGARDELGSWEGADAALGIGDAAALGADDPQPSSSSSSSSSNVGMLVQGLLRSTLHLTVAQLQAHAPAYGKQHVQGATLFALNNLSYIQARLSEPHDSGGGSGGGGGGGGFAALGALLGADYVQALGRARRRLSAQLLHARWDGALALLSGVPQRAEAAMKKDLKQRFKGFNQHFVRLPGLAGGGDDAWQGKTVAAAPAARQPAAGVGAGAPLGPRQPGSEAGGQVAARAPPPPPPPPRGGAGGGRVVVAGEQHAIPERELRQELARAAAKMVAPAYAAFYAQFAGTPFKHPEKHVLFGPAEIDGALRSVYLTEEDRQEAAAAAAQRAAAAARHTRQAVMTV
jgi:hypothetical protein